MRGKTLSKLKNSARRIAIAFGLITLGLGFAAYLVLPMPEAPWKDQSTTLPSPTQPVRHANATVPIDLQDDLERHGFASAPIETHTSEGMLISTQLWTSEDDTQVELNDLGSGIMKLHVISYPGGAGTWKNFWCAPAEGETLTQAINYQTTTVRPDIKSGTAPLHADVTTPRGTKEYRSSLATCYVK
jgi:hypothetical protein